MLRTTRRLCRRLPADYAADYAADYTQASARACKCLATLAQSVCSPEKVHISKHQCYRTMWNYISEATAKKPASEIDQNAPSWPRRLAVAKTPLAAGLASSNACAWSWRARA